MSRSGYVPKRLCPEVAKIVPKRLCPEMVMSRSGYVPKRLCPEVPDIRVDHWKKKLHWPMLPALVTTVGCYLWHRVSQVSVPKSGQVFGISGCMVMDILLAVNTVIQCKHSDIKVSSEDMPVKCDDVDDVSLSLG